MARYSLRFQRNLESEQLQPVHKPLLQERGAPLLQLLWQRLCSDEVINYFPIDDQALDRVTDIFVRVNSSGVQLTKTDLLFSSIVAHWQGGRAEIEECLKALNSKGSHFAFNNDFVMRSCLVLCDLPILFKVNSFKKENILLIRKHWPGIRAALDSTVDLLVEWGFSGETLSALNAIIPIAYFAFKGGHLGESKTDLQQYVVRSLLNRLFSSKTDRVIAAIRDHLRREQIQDKHKLYVLTNLRFDLKSLISAKLPDARTLAVTDEDIEELLAERKGPYTFMILSLLYPQLKFHQVSFHQDHIHPWAQFEPSRLRESKIDKEKAVRWQQARDSLPNLQLMEGIENKSKNDTPFDRWIKTLDSSKIDHFMTSNFIPHGISLALDNFDEFLEARRDLLRIKVKQALQYHEGIQKSSDTPVDALHSKDPRLV